MNSTFSCIFCYIELENIFIRCKECSQVTNICLSCFSKGLQTEHHRNNHEYRVFNLNQMFTFSNWTAKQELRLLNSIKHNKELNWSNVSHCVSIDDSCAKSSIECKDHFEDWMMLLMPIDDMNCSNNLLHLFTGNSSFNFRDNDANPFRPQVLSSGYTKLSGYRAARGDFETVYDDKYEAKNVSELDFESAMHVADTCYHEDDDEVDIECETEEDEQDESEGCQEQIELELKLCILKSYREVIKKRYAIKKFIRNFGLFNEIASNTLKGTNGIKNLNFNLKFYRLFKDTRSLMGHLELLDYQTQLKNRISELNELHENGLSSFKHVKMYKSLQAKRENTLKTSHLGSLLAVIRYEKRDDLFKVQNCRDWIKKTFFSDRKTILPKYQSVIHTTKSILRDSPKQEIKYNPLKIENYPDCDKLNDDEKEFCSLARIQPVVYLRVKEILMQECSKQGFVTYSRARKIAGIDVNKTRKIHNLMLKLNLIKESVD